MAKCTKYLKQEIGRASIGKRFCILFILSSLFSPGQKKRGPLGEIRFVKQAAKKERRKNIYIPEVFLSSK